MISFFENLKTFKEIFLPDKVQRKAAWCRHLNRDDPISDASVALTQGSIDSPVQIFRNFPEFLFLML